MVIDKLLSTPALIAYAVIVIALLIVIVLMVVNLRKEAFASNPGLGLFAPSSTFYRGERSDPDGSATSFGWTPADAAADALESTESLSPNTELESPVDLPAA